MEPWLWDVWDGPVLIALGVTDSGPRARQAAAECIARTQSTAARVEKARYVYASGTLTFDYRRTGEGWMSRRGDSGTTWEPLPESAASAS